MRKKINISLNKNQSQNSSNNANNQNSSDLNNNNSSKNRNLSKKKYIEEKAKKLKEKEIEDQKKENQLEDEIRDHLKCYICLSKVFKPKMCRYCKKICCAKCIDKWLEDHSFCGICKHDLSPQDMISVPFLDDMSTFFINNIDNPKKKFLDNSRTTIKRPGENIIPGPRDNINNAKKIQKLNFVNRPNINININNNLENNLSNIENEVNETEEDELDENICQEHGENISYYCIQCDKYFCSKCLVFFGAEQQKHKNHYIVPASKINDLGVTQAIKEYKKLGETKEKIKNVIGLINMIKKEKDIKKYEILNTLDLIREYNKIKMDEELKKYQDIISYVKTEKNNIEQQSKSLPNELSYILDQNDINKANEINNKIISLNNKIPPQMYLQLQEQGYQSQNIYIENFQTDFIQKRLNINEELNDNCEIINIPISLIPHHSANFSINYSNGIFRINFIVSVNDDINSAKYPIYNTYIIFRGMGYSMEFITLKNEFFEKKRKKENLNGLNRREQINTVNIEKDKFLYLCDNQYQIQFKICVVKLSFK